jgi:hypothetical protein
MANVQVDWLDFFVKTVDEIHGRLSVVLTASGCREGWLQAEFYLAGRQYNLRVNERNLGARQTADMSCGDGPDMLAEIKIVGAHCFPKMQGFVESDVERMRAVNTPCTSRYLILIVPRSTAKTKLGDYLHTCSFSSKCVERDWPEFRLRVWEL